MAGESALEDKTQIGTSNLAKDLMGSSPMKDYFSLQQDAIKFAVAVALANNLEPVIDEPSIVNSQHTASLDEDRSLKFLLENYKRSQTPYRLAEQLAEAGFRYIRKCIDEHMMFEDLFESALS